MTEDEDRMDPFDGFEEGSLEGQEFDTPPNFPSRSADPAEYEREEEVAMEPEEPGAAAVGEDFAAVQAQDALVGGDRRLLEIKRAVEEQLVQRAGQRAAVQALDAFSAGGNVQGVAIGEGIVDGALGASTSSVLVPGQPTLTLFVAEPTSVDQAKAAMVDVMGIRAASSDDVPIQVVVTGIIDAQPHRFRIRSAPGGVSVAHLRVTAGTIGCLARGRTSPRNTRLLLLSNNHVLANSNNARYGDCICQPGPADRGRCPADQIAILERFVPINFTPGIRNYVDCATGWANPNLVRRELVYLRNGQPQFFRISSTVVNPTLGMTVGKSGRTTQLTSGRITAVGATINVNYNGRIATFADQIAIQSSSGYFSQGGDSGSSIWTWAAPHYPVGLLFAGGGTVTFANRMPRVLQALDIGLYT